MFALAAALNNHDKMFAATSDAVTLEGYGRLDSAVFFIHRPRLHTQLNVENLTGEHYFASPH